MHNQQRSFYWYRRTFNDYSNRYILLYKDKNIFIKWEIYYESKEKEADSGSYVNGVYTTINGFSGSGLNCPKGARLYNTSSCPIFFLPEDAMEGEEFRMITPEVAQDVLPYYAISNYGRVENINTGKIMKPNYRV